MAGAEIARIPVAIVGGGSTGLVLALFLDFYGVRSILYYCVVVDVALARGSTARTPRLSRRPLNTIPVAPRGHAATQYSHPDEFSAFLLFAGCPSGVRWGFQESHRQSRLTK